MMRGMFAAISGLRAHQTMLDVVANNIANVNTIGFKSERVTFKDTLSQMVSGASAPAGGGPGGTNALQVGLGVQVGSIDNQMGAGATQSTGGALDLAIQGDGFFRVATTTGAAANVNYTRAGNFSTDANGDLVTDEGYYVLDNTVVATPNNKINIPTDAKSVSIAPDGTVSYVDGATGATTVAGQISLAKFPNPAGLERVSGNRFAASNNSGAETCGVPGDTNGLGTLAAGAVEMSNVDLAQEFTSLITAQRGFQANSRVITTADSMLQEARRSEAQLITEHGEGRSRSLLPVSKGKAHDHSPPSCQRPRSLRLARGVLAQPRPDPDGGGESRHRRLAHDSGALRCLGDTRRGAGVHSRLACRRDRRGAQDRPRNTDIEPLRRRAHLWRVTLAWGM